MNKQDGLNGHLEEGDMVRVRGRHYGTVTLIAGKYAKVRTAGGVYTFYVSDLSLVAKKNKETPNAQEKT